MYEPKVGDRVQRVHGLVNHCVPDLVMGEVVKVLNGGHFSVQWNGLRNLNDYDVSTVDCGAIRLICFDQIDEWEGNLELS